MRYETQTYMTPTEVMEAATSFFGVELGLELQNQAPDTLHFVGGGGHVTLSTRDANPVSVDIETREWDSPVEDFMGRIARKRWWRRFWSGVKEELG